MTRVVLAISLLAATAATAHAQSADIDAAKRFVLTLTEPARDVDAPSPTEKSDILAGLATPFWYDGFSFASVDDEAAAKRCKKTFKRTGTLKDAAKLTAFVDCLTYAMFAGALDGDAEWAAVDLKKLP